MDTEFTALKSALQYDKSTGVFTWLIKGHRNAVGDVAGTIDNGYRAIKFRQRKYRAHRLAWLFENDAWPTQHIDHINGDRSDNRIENLRDVTRAINNQNRRSARIDNKSSGLLGVTKSRGKWAAQIFVSGRNKGLGHFNTPEQAHQAYLGAKRKFHEGCTL